MTRLIYSIGLYLALPAVLTYFLWRGLREPGYLRGWGERFGFVRRPPPDGIWLHAASVGEVIAALPLLRALRERYPDWPCVVTTFTPTGRDRVREALDETMHVYFLPLDMPGSVRRFLRRVEPRLGVVMEAEIWPNLLHACGRENLPVLLANARLSESGARRYRHGFAGRLMREAIGRFARIGAVSADDLQRFADLDYPADRLFEAGNLKFDLEMPADAVERGRALRSQWQATDRPVWIAASTHDGEENVVLEVFERLRERHPDLLLVLAPRHPQRFESVAGLCRERGLAIARRSRGESPDARTPVLLADTLGELRSFYGAADLAFVGGSLVENVGGHNLLEPAAARLPVVTGTHLGNWSQVADWLREVGALCRVADAASLAQAVDECLEDHAGRKRAGLAAARVVAEHGGARDRLLRSIASLLAG